MIPSANLFEMTARGHTRYLMWYIGFMTAKSYPVQRHVPVKFNMEVPPPPGNFQHRHIYHGNRTIINT